MKKIYLLLFICSISIASFAQVSVSQGFENSGALPTGWTTSVVSGTYNWIVATSGSSPSCTPHGGSYMMEYQSYNQSSGGYAILVSPVVDWSQRSGAATTVQMWYYRDCSAYNTSSYSLEGVTAYVNTTNSLSGSPVSLGFVPRAGSRATSGGVTGTSTTTTTGWYQYTFTVPTTYNSATNYLVFKVYSQDGDNQFMDDVSYTTYPCINSAIGGNSGPVCLGSAMTLTDATTGGTWSSANTAVATIGSSSGIINGVAAGSAVISYTALCGTVVTTTVSVPGALAASSGNTPVCQGNTITLTNGSGTGTWSCGATGIATVNVTSGVVTGISAGTAPVTFTLTSTGCSNIATVTVNTMPSSITGGLAVCAGASSTLFSSPAGGAWASSNTLSATVGSSSGIVTGVASGNPSISYTLPGSCSVSAQFTVNPQPGAITGAATFCGSQSTTLGAAPAGGTWTSSNTGVATTAGSLSGTITGITAGGSATITYTLPAGCLSVKPVTVNPLGTITGVSGTCAGATTSLADIITGGTWSSSNNSIATVGSGTGILTGVSSGSATISYTLPVTGCIATVLKTITGSPALYGATGGGAFCPGGTGLHIGLGNSAVGFNYQLSTGGVLTGASLPGTGSSLDFGLISTPGTYVVVANPLTSCATNMTGTATVVSYPLPSAYNVTGGGSYCAGGTGLHIYLGGSNTGTTYQLYNSLAAVNTPVTGTSGILDFGLQTAGGTYTVVATNTATSCTSTMTGTQVISTNSLPAVFAITGGGSYCSGGLGMPVGLLNSTTGINYQLYRGGTPVGSPVAGTGSAITFGIQGIAGNYSAAATNMATGCTTNMSGTVAVSVNPLPSLFTVTGGGAYCTGGTGVHIGLGSSAAGVNYQMISGGVPTGAIVAGTGAAIDFGLVTTAGTYTVLATNASASCTSTMTGSTAVSISPAPAVYTVTGGGSYCSGGSGVHVTLNGSQIGTKYYLYNGTTLTGGCSGTGAPIDFGFKTGAGSYTAVATILSTGCTGNMTGTSAVTVNSITVYTVSGGASYCSGSAGPHVLQSGSDAGIIYQLLKNGSPVGTPVTGTGTAIDFGAQTAAATYTVKAANTGTGCTTNMSGNAIVTINPAPSNYSLTGGGNYCSGGTGVHIGLASSNTGISYSLKVGGVPVGTSVSGSGAALDFGLQATAGTYTVIAANTTTTCTGTMPGSVSVTANAVPNTYSVTGGGNYCSGGAGSHIGLSNSTSGINYQLYNGTVAAGGAITGSGSVIDFGLQTVAGTYTVIARNPVTTCTNTMTGNTTIGINPSPASYPVTGGGGFCPGGAGVDIGLFNSTSGVTYQLFNGSTASGISISGTGSAIDFGLRTAAGTYTVMATNAATSCTGNMPGSASVSVSPLPVIHTVTGGGSYCTGGAGLNIGLDGSTTGTNYKLYIGGISTGVSISGTGSALNFGPQTAAGAYTIAATNSITGCTANMAGSAAVVVSTHPTIYYITGGGGYCPGGAGVHIGLSGSDNGIYYELYNGGSYTGVVVAGTGGAIDFGLQSATGIYTVVATSTSFTCTGNMAGTANVYVSSLPSVYTITGGGNYCAGASSTAHIGLDGSNPGIAYRLYRNGVPAGAAITGTGALLDFGVQPMGNYTVVATSGGACSINMNGVAAVVAKPLPAVHTVTGGGNYCAGGAGLHMLLDGSATGVTYQLFAGGMPVGAAINGNGDPLDFGLQAIAGNYTVIATNTTSFCTNNMAGAPSITIESLPMAYSVSGGGTYCSSGTGVHIALSGSASGITYQLYNGTTPEGTSIYGTGSSIDFGLQTEVGNYTVAATNTATTCMNTMNGSAAIATLPIPVAYNVTGGGNYCAGGEGVHIRLSGSNSGIIYRLYNGVTVTGSELAGTGAPVDFGLQTSEGIYTVTGTNNITGCSNTMPGSVSVTVSQLPAVYTISGSGTSYCSGGTGISIYLSNSAVGVNYQLSRGMLSIGSSVAGNNGVVSFSAQTVAGVYTVVAIDASTGCKNNMSGNVPVSINPLPSAYTVTGGGGYCPGSDGAHIGLNNSNEGISYQLYHSGAAIGSPVYGNGAAIDFGLQTLVGNYTVIATNINTTCTKNMNGVVSVSVNPLPASFSVTGGGSFCTGGTGVGVGLSGSVAGTSYQLLNNTVAAGAPVTAYGGAIDFGLQTVSGNYTVMATNPSTGCSGNMPGSVAVISNPLPAAYAVTGGGNYCAGGAGVNIGISNSNPGVSYSLYNDGAMTGATVPGTGYALGFGLQTARGSYTIVATNPATSCISNMPGSASVIINPLPARYIVTGGGNYCAGGNGIAIGLTSSDTGTSYTLFNISSTIGTFAGTGLPLDFDLQKNTGLYTVTAANIITGCTNNMYGDATVGITPVVTPAVSIFNGVGDTVCSGNQVNFTAIPTNGGVAPIYQWTVNGSKKSTSVSYSYEPADGDIVAVTLTSSAACSVPATVSNSAGMTVNLKQMPVVNVSANPGIEVCKGTTVAFTTALSGGGAAPILEWMKNGDSIGSSAAYSYIPADGDVITCKMISNYQCRLANSAISIPVGMKVDNPVTPTVAIAAYPGLHIAPGEQETLVATVSNGGLVPTYQWLVNGTIAAGATTPTFITRDLADSDVISCDVLSGGGCSGIPGSGRVSIYVSNVGVQNIAPAGSDIKILPNPNNGAFLVKGTIGTTTGEVTIEVNDMTGHVIYNSRVVSLNGAIEERIQLSNAIPNGMYLLDVRSGAESKVFHMVVEQ